MNHPYNIAGGQTAFFADLAFFSDQELLFMRHAPGQMGDAVLSGIIRQDRAAADPNIHERFHAGR